MKGNRENPCCQDPDIRRSQAVTALEKVLGRKAVSVAALGSDAAPGEADMLCDCDLHESHSAR